MGRFIIFIIIAILINVFKKFSEAQKQQQVYRSGDTPRPGTSAGNTQAAPVVPEDDFLKAFQSLTAVKKSAYATKNTQKKDILSNISRAEKKEHSKPLLSERSADHVSNKGLLRTKIDEHYRIDSANKQEHSINLDFSREGLHSAFIMKEIFSPPLSLRKGNDNWF